MPTRPPQSPFLAPPPAGGHAEDPVVPSAIVTAADIEEVNDGRGRRLLEGAPPLTAYARAFLACDLPVVRFVWIAPDRTWLAVRLQRVPRVVGADVAALVEAVAVARPCGLTVRELDVLTLLAGGLSNPEIAAHLTASPRTVSTHVRRVLAKLGQATRAGAAAVAIEQGLLRLPVPGGGRSLEGLSLALVDEVAEGRAPRTRRPLVRPAPLGGTRPRPYLIGSAIPLGGTASADGIELRNGSNLAIAEINARGGIGGRRLEQLVVDMDITTAAGVEAALDRLVAAEVDAITTGYELAEELTGYEAVSDYGCPLLSSMTSEMQAQWVRDDPERLGHLFQTGPTEIHYGTGFVRFLDELEASGAWHPPNRRLIFVETPAASGQTSLPATIEAVERSGWTIDSLVSVATHDADWSTALRQIRAAAPAAVMLSHFVPAEVAAFQRSFAADPTDSLVYGIYAPSVPDYLDLAGAAAEGVVWATVSGLYADQLGVSFGRRYEQAYGRAPGRSLAGIAYDQVNLLTTAWARVRNPRAFGDVTAEIRRIVHRGVNGMYVLGNDRQCGLAYPDETPDPSLGQAHLVFQVQSGEHRILRPLPYADGAFRTPSWFG
jgi:branched-chain amino acid transport system substrate-binding protein